MRGACRVHSSTLTHAPVCVQGVPLESALEKVQELCVQVRDGRGRTAQGRARQCRAGITNHLEDDTAKSRLLESARSHGFESLLLARVHIGIG